MKTIKYIAGIIFTIIIMQSCKESASIQIQNNISKVTITDVKWGKKLISNELITGEMSSQMTIGDLYDEKLPQSHKITFKMSANNNTIYLETEEEFILNQGDQLVIILDDDTKVKNPNDNINQTIDKLYNTAILNHKK